MVLCPGSVSVARRGSLGIFPGETVACHVITDGTVSVGRSLMDVNIHPLPELSIGMSSDLSQLRVPGYRVSLAPLAASVGRASLSE